MEEVVEIAGKIFDFYSEVMQKNISIYEATPEDLHIPIIPRSILFKLCQTATTIFEQEPVVLQLCIPVVVVGDLHGHLLDLFRILKRYGFPPSQKYLFLGDLVDRGEFSTEVLTIVLILKILYPNHVYIIRGNHEFTQLCTQHGFSHELKMLYNDPSIEVAFLHAFAYMPLCALIGKNMFAVHGGIGPSVKTIQQLREIKRPFDNFDDDLTTELLWSDPDDDTDVFAPSPRGTGYLFGPKQVNEFLAPTHLMLLIRGHECVNGGTEYSCNTRVITVFSASNYCGISGNKAGVLVLHGNGQVDPQIFSPVTYIRRNQVTFILSESQTDFIPMPPRKVAASVPSSPLVQEPSLPTLTGAKPGARRRLLKGNDSQPNVKLKTPPRSSKLVKKSRSSLSFGMAAITSPVAKDSQRKPFS